MRFRDPLGRRLLSALTVTAVAISVLSAGPERHESVQTRSVALPSVAAVPVVHFGGFPRSAAPPVELSTQQLIALYFTDIQTFWKQNLPALYGMNLEPIKTPVAYRLSDAVALPTCNGIRLTPDVARDNAFFCLQENVIVYDADQLLPGLRGDYGNFAVGVLFAHEYGHAIQAQSYKYGSSIALELQADCFSGAWAASSHVARSLFPDRQVYDGVLRSYVEFSDPPGTDQSVAHGSTSNRSNAFMLGVRGGLHSCAELNEDPAAILAQK